MMVVIPILKHGGGNEVFAQTLGRPDAELGAPMRTNVVTDCQDGVQVVVVNRARNLAFSLGSNRQVLLDSCLRATFTSAIHEWSIPENEAQVTIQ